MSLASATTVGVWVVLSLAGEKEFVPGWLSIVSLVGLLGGIQLVCVGILGEYVGRTYEICLGRPSVIIRDSTTLTTVNRPDADSGRAEPDRP